MKNIGKNEFDFIRMLKPSHTFRYLTRQTTIEVNIFDFQGLHVARIVTNKRNGVAKEAWLIEDVSIFWPEIVERVRVSAVNKKAG